MRVGWAKSAALAGATVLTLLTQYYPLLAEAAPSVIPELTYLQSSVVIMPSQGAKPSPQIIRSFRGSDHAYTYDQALAITAFSIGRQRLLAESVLEALAKLQKADGSWDFGYRINKNHSVESLPETTRISGAIAWMVMAVNSYATSFLSAKYDAMARKALQYLETQIYPLSLESKSGLKGLVFSNEKAHIVGFEHNLDAYSAFFHFGKRLHEEKYLKTAEILRNFLESHWDGNGFHAGFDRKAQVFNLDEKYLDTQSWGILALGPKGQKGEDFKKGLDSNCKTFLKTQPTLGFSSYKPASGRQPASLDPVWSEGTYGMLLALVLSGKSECGGHSLADLTNAIQTIHDPDGGVRYATSNSDGNFPSIASVAGTAWAYFFKMQYNPFVPAVSQK